MNCPQCSAELKFFPPSVSRTKFDAEGNPKPVNASHRCQTEGCGFIHWLNSGKPGNGQARPQQATQAPPQRQPPPSGNRERSIHAQCAVKAACAYYSGQNVSPDEILLLASIFLASFDRVAAGGPLGKPTPQLAPTQNYAQPDPEEPPPMDEDAPWFTRGQG